jgi:hypothetical protein
MRVENVGQSPSLPTCIGRCTSTTNPISWAVPTGSYRDVPSGPCRADGIACTMGAQCATGGLVDGLTCTCTQGTWQCVISSQGGAGCDCTDETRLVEGDAGS